MTSEQKAKKNQVQTVEFMKFILNNKYDSADCKILKMLMLVKNHTQSEYNLIQEDLFRQLENKFNPNKKKRAVKNKIKIDFFK